MTSPLIRPVVAALLLLSLGACASPVAAEATPGAFPLGTDLGSSGPVVAVVTPAAMSAPALTPSAAPHPGMQMVHDGRSDAHGTGTVNSVDTAAHKINLSHQPIPTIGWPAMTMDFSVAPNVDLRAIKPGAKVNFTIERGADGMYQVQSIAPAAGAR